MLKLFTAEVPKLRHMEMCIRDREGIIGGDGLGSFRPKDNVTAQELAKMLLVILGQDPESYSGAGWAERVNADAQSFGIYYGLTAQVSQPVTRDNACLLIYNAMRCPAIADPDACLLYTSRCV